MSHFNVFTIEYSAVVNERTYRICRREADWYCQVGNQYLNEEGRWQTRMTLFDSLPSIFAIVSEVDSNEHIPPEVFAKSEYRCEFGEVIVAAMRYDNQWIIQSETGWVLDKSGYWWHRPEENESAYMPHFMFEDEQEAMRMALLFAGRLSKDTGV